MSAGADFFPILVDGPMRDSPGAGEDARVQDGLNGREYTMDTKDSRWCFGAFDETTCVASWKG